MMMDSGERNPQAIAQAAEISNPKRIYFLLQEVKSLPLQQLISALPLLLELEASLKQGASETSTLQTKVIELCQICRRT
jgi:DNA polymerase-3 subunit delta